MNAVFDGETLHPNRDRFQQESINYREQALTQPIRSGAVRDHLRDGDFTLAIRAFIKCTFLKSSGGESSLRETKRTVEERCPVVVQ
jgi:hypothetical protein